MWLHGPAGNVRVGNALVLIALHAFSDLLPSSASMLPPLFEAFESAEIRQAPYRNEYLKAAANL
jgi:hypothetical protein